MSNSSNYEKQLNLRDAADEHRAEEERRRKQAEEDERAWRVMHRNDLYAKEGINPFLLPWDYLKY